MCESYCGQDCNKCEKREEFQCPGCKQGPGKYNPSKCDLSNCCQNKGHESCKTCTLSGGCHLLQRRGYVVEAMLAKQKAEAQSDLREDLREDEKSKFLGKWFTVLFAVLLISITNSILSEDFIVDMLPALSVPTMVISTLCSIGYAVILLIMSRYSDYYKTAAISKLISELGAIVLLFFFGEENNLWTLLITIPLMIVSIYSVLNLCEGHAEVLSLSNPTLSSKWNRMYCYKMYIIIGTIACTLLVLIPIVNVIAAFAFVVIIIAGLVVSVLEIVYLYQTMKHFRNYSLKNNAGTVVSK